MIPVEYLRYRSRTELELDTLCGLVKALYDLAFKTPILDKVSEEIAGIASLMFVMEEKASALPHLHRDEFLALEAFFDGQRGT